MATPAFSPTHAHTHPPLGRGRPKEWQVWAQTWVGARMSSHSTKTHDASQGAPADPIIGLGRAGVDWGVRRLETSRDGITLTAAGPTEHHPQLKRQECTRAPFCEAATLIPEVGTLYVRPTSQPSRCGNTISHCPWAPPLYRVSLSTLLSNLPSHGCSISESRRTWTWFSPSPTSLCKRTMRWRRLVCSLSSSVGMSTS